jgi:3-deoxy-D-manno-octulosonic-acid transferase
MRIKDIIFVEGSFRDTLFANNALEDEDRCVEICVLLGVEMSEAEEYFEIIQNAPTRRCVPSSQRNYGRELVEDALMDKVEIICLQALCRNLLLNV